MTILAVAACGASGTDDVDLTVTAPTVGAPTSTATASSASTTSPPAPTRPTVERPLPAGFERRAATGPFEPTALPAGFVVETRFKVRPAPPPVADHRFMRIEPDATIAVTVRRGMTIDLPSGERVTGVRPVEVRFSTVAPAGLVVLSFTEDDHLVSVSATGLDRAEVLEVVRHLRGA